VVLMVIIVLPGSYVQVWIRLGVVCGLDLDLAQVGEGLTGISAVSGFLIVAHRISIGNWAF